MKQTIKYAALLLLLTGCARQQEAVEPQVQAETPPTAAPASNKKDVPLNAPQIVAPIEVKITLSPKAEAQIASSGETIVIEAVYAGDPAPGSSAPTNDFGLVDMGKAVKELKAAGTVKFAEDVIDKSLLSSVTGQPQILLNVHSGKKASPTNILACAFYWDSVKVASAKTVEIPCKLLNETP